MIRHILPNVLAPVMVVVVTLELGVVIVTEASLSFRLLRCEAWNRHLDAR